MRSIIRVVKILAFTRWALRYRPWTHAANGSLKRQREIGILPWFEVTTNAEWERPAH